MIPIVIQEEQSIPVVIPEGRLDTTNSSDFDQFLKPVLEKQDYLVIDLSQCHYLSSSGIRILLATEKKLLSKGGKLFLSGILPEVYQVIEMTGLLQVFTICRAPEEARQEIERIRMKTGGFRLWQSGSLTFQFHPLEDERKPARLWINEGIAGYNELGVSVGTGSPAETPQEDPKSRGIFVSTGRCTGFIPADPDLSPDFRISQNPAQAGVFVGQALSFDQQPVALLRLSDPAGISLNMLMDALCEMKREMSTGHQDVLEVIIADFNPAAPSVMLGLIADSELDDALGQPGADVFPGPASTAAPGVRLYGARFLLGEVPAPPDDPCLSGFLEKVLTIENITGVEGIKPDDQTVNPLIWMFVSAGMENASVRRLQVETAGGFELEPHKVFLTRRLYADSGRLEIRQIHGGYSAQTYSVTSYDPDGRRLRPTVLKIADRAMISRESDRCRRYALPYILNNSAMVLGTEFFGDTGALRYNFVGIGGEHTQLKWLTHYFNSWPVEKLMPLFDKIFLQILNPWYGQPIREDIHPFRDHDPTFTFFPHLYDTAEKMLSVTSASPRITVEETGQSIINPYWYLKNEFSRRRDENINYYSGICHGDLNMQNILLDEDMNIYLIDFSETKPRSLISDFARLEAIFMVDNAPMETEADAEEYVKFITRFYSTVQLDRPPANTYRGRHNAIMDRNLALCLKMREYALNSVKGDPNPVPYCLALLEWILPVVCYWTISPAHKRLSMIVSGLLCGHVSR